MADFTDRYNTKLSEPDEKLYQLWLKTLPKEQQNTYDYDMRGAWQAGEGQGDNGHFTDKFKKPNHPTFSSESIYNVADGQYGGEWFNIFGRDVFVPSETNLTQNDSEWLRKYFTEAEPSALLMNLNDILKV